MVAVRRIEKGESLTNTLVKTGDADECVMTIIDNVLLTVMDFSNVFRYHAEYVPRTTRQLHLWSTYGFLCTCTLCCIDTVRAFKCINCNGIVYPHWKPPKHYNEITETLICDGKDEYKCSSCYQIVDNKIKDMYENMVRTFRNKIDQIYIVTLQCVQ